MESGDGKNSHSGKDSIRYHQMANSAPTRTAEEHSEAPVEDPIGKKSILIVDDEAPFRFAAGIALRRKGFRVTEAGDGKQALDKVLEARDRGEPFHLIVTDIRMPELSGLELIDELKRHEIAMPVCAITCFGDKELVCELYGKGCTDHLEKPFEPEDLVEWIGRILRRGEG